MTSNWHFCFCWFFCKYYALTLLVECQDKHQACKKLSDEVLAGYLSGVRCRLFVYGLADATAVPKLHHLLLHFYLD